MITLKYIPILLFIILSSYSFSEISAPSEMQWGQSQSDLKRSGLLIKDCKKSGELDYCLASGHDKRISFADAYYVYFIPGYGLQKVLVIGEDVTGDLYGSEGKATYNKVKNSLIKKYPEADGYEHSSFEWSCNKLYNELDEFYQCLKYDGCGSWTTFIGGANDVALGFFIIALKGSSRGTGYITLTYESPNWGKYLDEMDDKESAKDDEAF